MKIISKFRGRGKTTELIRLSAEKNIPILVFMQRKVEYIKEIAHQLSLCIPEPVVFSHRPIPKKILIDDVELCLSTLLGGAEIYAVTMQKQIVFTKQEIAEKLGLTTDDFTIVEN